jgi:hypothetical protein
VPFFISLKGLVWWFHSFPGIFAGRKFGRLSSLTDDGAGTLALFWIIGDRALPCPFRGAQQLNFRHSIFEMNRYEIAPDA